MGDDPNQRGNSRRWIVREVEDSLRRLGTDWIDLYQIHRPEPGTDIDETLGALTDLVRAGQGPLHRLLDVPGQRRSSRRSGSRRAARPRALRLRAAALLDARPRRSRRTCCPPAARHGMGVIPWSPLAGGWLSGRWRKGAERPESTARRPRSRPATTCRSRPTSASSRPPTRSAQLADEAGHDADPPGAGLRDPPPGGDGGDHRPADDGAARVPARRAPTSSLSDDVLDRIDEIVPPGTNVNPADAGWQNPDLEPSARRRAH